MASLFTIEQIELIRRLRNSGITREALIAGFDEFNRFYDDHSFISPSPVSSLTPPGLRSPQKTIALSDRTTSQSSEASEASLVVVEKTKSENGHKSPTHKEDDVIIILDDVDEDIPETQRKKLKSGTPSNFVLVNETPSQLITPVNSNKIDPQTEVAAANLRFINSDHAYQIKASSIEHRAVRKAEEIERENECILNDNSNSSKDDKKSSTKSSSPMSMNFEETPELVKFRAKNDEEILGIIRGFVIKYNIRQNMIAEMTRLSQGYVSRFFRGEMSEMSERARNFIYMWYLQCKDDPTKILYSCPVTVGDKSALSADGDLLPIKRDRFLFRKKHYEILEQYFRENPYPDVHTKEEISEACNMAVEKSGQMVPERYKVTVQIVSNWFNNKRKELKAGGLKKSKVLKRGFATVPGWKSNAKRTDPSFNGYRQRGLGTPSITLNRETSRRTYSGSKPDYMSSLTSVTLTTDSMSQPNPGPVEQTSRSSVDPEISRTQPPLMTGVCTTNIKTEPVEQNSQIEEWTITQKSNAQRFEKEDVDIIPEIDIKLESRISNNSQTSTN